MSLQFILGNSGSGKSRYLYQTVIEEARRYPERNYIILVPEQFTMQTEKDLIALHPDSGIMNIAVLSFDRLAYRVFEEVGVDQRTVLTETGKNLMIRKVAIEQQDRLPVLGSRMNRTGYVSEVKSILSEWMQYEITEFELQQMLQIAQDRPLLKGKLEDMRVLYRAFLDYQRTRFMKPEERLDVLCQAAGRSELLRGSRIVLDGFVGLTPAQLKVMEELLVYCPSVRMTVTMDAREPFYGEIREHELFAVSRRLIQAVRAAAQRAKARIQRSGADVGESFIKEPVILGKERIYRFAPESALAHLEQNLFRKNRRTYQGSAQDLSLHVCSTPAQEVHFAARMISTLVREKGYRYKEIAVITGDLKSYDNYVRRIFPLYDVPAFLDETRHILLNPCLEFVRGVLQAAEKDFTPESVFRCLRTGMLALTMEETDRLENYVLAAGIRGRKMWQKEWEYCHGGTTPEELEQCNVYREKVMEQLGSFAEAMQKNGETLRAYAENLVQLLEQCQVQQQLKDREMQLMQEGAREEAKEYSQIYTILITLLEECVDLMGDEPVSASEFSEILEAGFSEARAGIIPPGVDQVQVGDIQRSRLSHVKVLFFLGVNDGWVPARADHGGIVSDMERELLLQSGIELAPSARENSYIQRFYLYQNLTKPSDHLYLSWCSGSGDGTAMRPSYLINTVRRLFPDLPVLQETDAGSELYQITSGKNGMLYLTKGLEQARKGEEAGDWRELYRRYLLEEEQAPAVRRLVEAALLTDRSGSLHHKTAEELYGTVMKSSVTRLEQFAACAFAHFASYGLGLKERRLYGIEPVDLGTIFHNTLELFSRRIQREGVDWLEVTQERQQQIMERCVDEVTQEYGYGVFRSSAREQYTIRRLKRILCRSAWALREQLAAGTFRPSGFEVSFDSVRDLKSVNVSLGAQRKMHLGGRIDRIDTAETEEAVYVKVIDYKSGMQTFDPVSLYYGLQLQLVVYLNTALEMEAKLHKADPKEVVPAGIFYYHLQDPLLDQEMSEQETQEQLQQRMLKKLRPDGLVNDEEEVLQRLDAHMDGDSLVIPVGRKKNGGLKATSSTATSEQFALLSKFAARKMEKMGKQMMDGVTEAVPFSNGNSLSCDYCLFSDVCGFDRKIPEKCRKRTAAVKKDEVWEQMRKEMEDAEHGSEMDEGTAAGH